MEISQQYIGVIEQPDGYNEYLLLTTPEDEMGYCDAMEYADGLRYDHGEWFAEYTKVIRSSPTEFICVVSHRRDV